MNYTTSQNGLDLEITIKNFSLAQTLDCGQAFRWEKQTDDSFCGIAYGTTLHVSQQGDVVTFYNTSLSDFDSIWRRYFDFDTDYNAINNSLMFDKNIAAAIEYAGGIRLLKQEPWETLCSFIISQNNNIPRIKGIIARLCENFGEDEYSFPSAEKLATLCIDELSPLRSGFRAKYLIDAAQKVSSGEVNFEKINSSSLLDGEEELIKIYGVGKKVAQCVLLYGFHKLSAFPIDVWIKKVLATYFSDGFPEKANEYAGVAQQYLFHYIRKKELL